MIAASHIHVRPLEIGDFEFVQNLAAIQPNFTVPPTYVLWLIRRIRGAICLVAEHSSNGPIAYMLAVPVEGPEQAIFVWQFAASDGMHREKAALAVLTHFRTLITEAAIKAIFFSSIPSSRAYRVVRRYAWKVFSSIPEPRNPLPPPIDPKEAEFVLRLQGDTTTHLGKSDP